MQRTRQFPGKYLRLLSQDSEQASGCSICPQASSNARTRVHWPFTFTCWKSFMILVHSPVVMSSKPPALKAMVVGAEMLFLGRDAHRTLVVEDSVLLVVGNQWVEGDAVFVVEQCQLLVLVPTVKVLAVVNL